MKILKTFEMRHAIAVAMAVLLAILLMPYSFTENGWIVLSAFLVSQTTRGTPLRQGLIFFVTISIAITVSAGMMMFVSVPVYLLVTVALIYIACVFVWYLNQPLNHTAIYSLLYLAIITMFACLMPAESHNYIHDRILDVGLGSLLGVAATQLIFPAELAKEFNAGVVPVLRALKEYTKAWSEYFAKDGGNLKNVTQKKILIESALQEHQGAYPVWVYETGFNPALRSGFRFFLVTLEKVIETYFSLDYLGGLIAESNLPEDMARLIDVAMQKNYELITILTEYFATKNLTDTSSDFTSDIAALEQGLQSLLPDNLEVLDLSPHFMLLTAIVRDIKDLRGLLLQLVMALPKTE